MNMYGLLEANNGKVTMEEVENSFAGSICRCTGYRPILDAFKSLATDAPVDDIEDGRITCCSRLKKANYRHTSVKCAENCERLNEVLHLKFKDDKVWYRVDNLQQIFNILEGTAKNEKYMLVAGDTAHGMTSYKYQW